MMTSTARLLPLGLAAILGGCVVPQSPPATGPGVATALFLAVADENRQACRLIVREVEPHGGGGLDVFRLIDFTVWQTVKADQNGMDVTFGRGVVVGSGGATLNMAYPLSSLRFRLGGVWRDVPIHHSGRPATQRAAQGDVLVDSVRMSAEVSATVSQDVQVQMTLVSTGQTETWTVPPLTDPKDARRLQAFRQCIADLHIPSDSGART